MMKIINYLTSAMIALSSLSISSCNVIEEQRQNLRNSYIEGTVMGEIRDNEKYILIVDTPRGRYSLNILDGLNNKTKAGLDSLINEEKQPRIRFPLSNLFTEEGTEGMETDFEDGSRFGGSKYASRIEFPRSDF